MIPTPPWGPGGLSRECAPPYPQRDRKRRLNGAVCRNHRVGARTGTLKNPTKYLWRWEPDRRSNFFFNPPAHLCAVTYMTEISLIVTLNNQFTLPYPTHHPNDPPFTTGWGYGGHILDLTSRALTGTYLQQNYLNTTPIHKGFRVLNPRQPLQVTLSNQSHPHSLVHIGQHFSSFLLYHAAQKRNIGGKVT